MEHSLPLITTLVIAFGLALIFGFIAERFRAPALVGYLLAGIAAGQHTPGVFADPALANQLSELGVMLLMFGVGLHFSVGDLLKVKGIAVPGAVLQMTLATILGGVVAHFCWDWTWGTSIVFGMCLSCASTVVLLKALELRGILMSMDGQIAVGWLVVEDIATVMILVMLPPLAGLLGAPGSETLSLSRLFSSIGLTLLNVAAFIALMLVVGRKFFPWLMAQVARTGSRELFTLFVLTVAIGIAYGAAEIFHVSFALGAFFAGMVMRESKFAHRAATESLPLQDAFAVLFFVGVGMIFDWHVIVESPLQVLVVLFIILFGKSIGAFWLVHTMKYPLHTSLTVSVALAQIGEFSFILVAQAMTLGLADEHLLNLVVAGSILSIALNPLLFCVLPVFKRRLTSRFDWARKAALREVPYTTLPQETLEDRLRGQMVLIADGPIGLPLIDALLVRNIPLIVILKDAELANTLSEKGVSVIVGDACDPMVLVSAHVASASMLVLTSSNVLSHKVVSMARELNPTISISIVSSDAGAWDGPEKEDITMFNVESAAASGLAIDLSVILRTRAMKKGADEDMLASAESAH